MTVFPFDAPAFYDIHKADPTKTFNRKEEPDVYELKSLRRLISDILLHECENYFRVESHEGSSSNTSWYEEELGKTVFCENLKVISDQVEGPKFSKDNKRVFRQRVRFLILADRIGKILTLSILIPI